MKPKGKPDSKIPTAHTQINKKKSPDTVEKNKRFDSSLLKKNEFTLILFGALLLTIIVFFLFFRSSDTKPQAVEQGPSSSSFADLEKRIEKLELLLQEKEKTLDSTGDKTAKDISGIDPIKERVTRLETAFSVKFDSLTEKIGKIEKSISQKNTPPAVKTPPQKTETPAKPVKTAVKKTSLFHTVKKGETLYSISKKYNTTVAALRKLNNLSATAKIFPGNNILVR